MTTMERTHAHVRAMDGDQRRQPPSLARRTYMFVRLSVVAMIAILAASLIREYHVAGDCLQGSISAYYYTSVQSVFVGSLVALGLAMIVLWGKTPLEDSYLNLAGMLAPVVAFVPTAKTNKCGLDTATGAAVTTNRQQTRVIEASQDAIVNNMLAYFIVAGAVLLILIAVGAVAHVRNRTAATSGVPRGEETCASITEHPRAYWGPIAAASALWVAGLWKFANDREWFFDNAHGWSATVMFIFIVCVVVTVALQKHHGTKEAKEPRSLRWAWTYWAIAVLMVVGAVAIFVETRNGSDGFATHRVFWLEAWMISWLGLFWVLQTIDRWNEGAPARTTQDRRLVAAGAPAPARVA